MPDLGQKPCVNETFVSGQKRPSVSRNWLSGAKKFRGFDPDCGLIPKKFFGKYSGVCHLGVEGPDGLFDRARFDLSFPPF